MTESDDAESEEPATDPGLYREIVESSNDVATIIDTDGRITYVSPSVERVLGYEPEELVGKVGFEYQHPDGRDVIAERIEALKANPDEPQTAEVRFERADGSWCWVAVTMRNRLDDGVIDGILVNSRDVTERVRRERTHRRLAEEYEALLQNSGDAIFLLDVDSDGGDPEFRFARLSPGYETQTGLSTEAVRDKTPREVFGEERGAELEQNYRECVERGEPISYQEELSVAEDARFWQTSLAPVTVDGAVVRIVGVARNVTGRVQRERKLRRKNDRLDDFASVVSHDIRNPLNVAKGRAALLEQEVESEHVPALVRSLERIEAIVEDTLVLARAGETLGKREPVSMTDMVDQCWDAVESEDATLEVEDEFAVRGDPDRLRHVFENLFRNSVEHSSTSPGSHARQDAVEHSSASPGSHARQDAVAVRVGRLGDGGFYVEDDGPGISPDRRGAVFDSGETSLSGGTGLGLAIVKRIAEAHGWQVDVTDGRDGGARFEFTGVTVVS